MYDVVALGELLIDFTPYGKSNQNNDVLEVNPGGAPCNVLSMLSNLGYKTGFIGNTAEACILFRVIPISSISSCWNPYFSFSVQVFPEVIEIKAVF